ncbi:MAG: hypothetical protein WB424_13890 [Terracidiphilus sp.]
MNQPDAPTPTTIQAAVPGVTIKRIAYQGWPECFLLSNGLVEAVVVPAIGRVMRFGLIGEPESAFWQNRELDGQLPAAEDSQWMNFGGDKSWPAPQSEWQQRTGRDWPPPRSFDAGPAQAAAVPLGVKLTSPIDSAYGIQILRTVTLDPTLPVMRIATEFRKLQGPPVTVAIWTITQLRDPEAILMLASDGFPHGYLPLLEAEPTALQRRGCLLSFKRNPSVFTKIGSQAASMAWIGKSSVLRIDAEIGPGVYPDGGCVTQVYTNPNPQKYVELETLGPLQNIRPGDTMHRTTAYTILPRRLPDLNFASEMPSLRSDA